MLTLNVEGKFFVENDVEGGTQGEASIWNASIGDQVFPGNENAGLRVVIVLSLYDQTLLWILDQIALRYQPFL